MRPIMEMHESLLSAPRTRDREAPQDFSEHHATDLTAYLAVTWHVDGIWNVPEVVTGREWNSGEGRSRSAGLDAGSIRGGCLFFVVACHLRQGWSPEHSANVFLEGGIEVTAKDRSHR